MRAKAQVVFRQPGKNVQLCNSALWGLAARGAELQQPTIYPVESRSLIKLRGEGLPRTDVREKRARDGR